MSVVDADTWIGMKNMSESRQGRVGELIQLRSSAEHVKCTSQNELLPLVNEISSNRARNNLSMTISSIPPLLLPQNRLRLCLFLLPLLDTVTMCAIKVSNGFLENEDTSTGSLPALHAVLIVLRIFARNLRRLSDFYLLCHSSP
jgi:hypothetical protein